LFGTKRPEVQILSPRLVRNSKSRQRLREPLLAGFELLHGRFTLSRLYAAQGSRPRREAARAFSPNQTRLLEMPVRPRAATCRSRSARRRRASRHRRSLGRHHGIALVEDFTCAETGRAKTSCRTGLTRRAQHGFYLCHKSLQQRRRIVLPPDQIKRQWEVQVDNREQIDTARAMPVGGLADKCNS
jgi:hypothetical protein